MLALDMFRFNARLKALTIAIGVCVAFIVGSFAFAYGLGSTVENITTKFESEGAIAFQGDDLSFSVIDLTGVAFDRSFAAVQMCQATTNITGENESVFFSVSDPEGVLDQDLSPDPGEMLTGSLDSLQGFVTVQTSGGSAELTVNGTYYSEMFPDYWHLISMEDMELLHPGLAGKASFLLFDTVDGELLQSIKSQGLSVIEMTAILDYFSAGSAEVESDLWLIILPSSFIVAMLVYSAVAMEAHDRRTDIAILKTMGASNRQVGGIFFFQALVLSVLGGLIGIMIGIVVAYAISTASSIAIENSLFYLRVTEYSMLIAFTSSLIAGCAGSLYPIRRAMRQRVREALT